MCDCHASPPPPPKPRPPPIITSEPKSNLPGNAAFLLPMGGHVMPLSPHAPVNDDDDFEHKFELTEAQKHRNEMIVMQLRCGIISIVLTVVGVLFFVLWYR